MDDRRKSLLQQLVLAAASNPVNLSVLGGGLIAGVMLRGFGGPSASGWGSAIIVLGVMAYLALATMDLTSKRFAEKSLGKAKDSRLRIRSQLEPLRPEQIQGQALRAVYSIILANLERIRSTHAAGSDDTRELLASSLAHCEKLAEEAGRAAAKGNPLSAYLATENPTGISGEILQLERDAEAARDPKAKENYQKAAESKRQQLETYQQIEGLYDRIRAQLSVIETALDGVNAKLVKLSATDIQEVMVTNESIGSHLQSMTSDIHILESAVDETIQEFAL